MCYFYIFKGIVFIGGLTKEILKKPKGFDC